LLKSYKYRLYPDEKQKEQIGQALPEFTLLDKVGYEMVEGRS